MFVSLEENLIEVDLRISFEVAISKIKSSIILSVYKFASYIQGLNNFTYYPYKIHIYVYIYIHIYSLSRKNPSL